MKGKSAIWEPIDKYFILKNYQLLSWQKLLVALNEIRDYDKQVSLSELRHQMHRMNLKKGNIQIRWAKKDIKFLIDSYKTKGDKEIAELLNANNNTFRVIDGKKVYRLWKKKHIEKKMTLLGLKRTHEEFLSIVRRNRELYGTKIFTKDDNLYTRGIKQPKPENTIRINQGRRFIKIDGKFIIYARWLYEQVVAPVPDGMAVYHKDFDSLNDEIDNLELIEYRKIGGRITKSRLLEAKKLLAARKNDNAQSLQKTTDHRKIRELMGISLRISKIQKFVDEKLSKFKH